MADFALGAASNMGGLHQQANEMKQLQKLSDRAKTETSKPEVMGNKELIARHAKLKKAAQQLEGVFFQQLLEAMDKTVDREGSIMGGGEGEKTFREMMNQNIAESISTAPGGSGFGLGEQIYQQLSAKLPPLSADTATAHKAYGNS